MGLLLEGLRQEMDFRRIEKKENEEREIGGSRISPSA